MGRTVAARHECRSGWAGKNKNEPVSGVSLETKVLEEDIGIIRLRCFKQRAGNNRGSSAGESECEAS